MCVQRFSVFAASTGGTGVRYLGDEPLVLAQPRLPHGGFAVEASGELLQFLLTNQLRPQSQLPLVLRLLQTLPCLKQTHTLNISKIDIL